MSPLTVLGEFTASISFRHASYQQGVYVIKDLKHNLLGLPAITSLNLVSRVDSLQFTAMDIKHQYPQLFCGLGMFGEEYEVSLTKDVKPFALHTARSVPLPLHGKVQITLVSLGIISPVSDSSQWCAGIVVVPKSLGQVRICVHIKHLIECVQKEFYPLPYIEKTLAQLAGAKYSPN